MLAAAVKITSRSDFLRQQRINGIAPDQYFFLSAGGGPDSKEIFQ